MTDRTAPSHAERARTLAASRTEGALSTLARDPAGHPYASHVIYAMDGARPIFLLSRLAEHTQNLEADARASLLVVEPEGDEAALARGRVTLVGSCRRVEDRASVEERFLARHPDARAYAGFADFAYYALDVESARWVGGFGRMSWIDRAAWEAAEPDPLLPSRAGILAHMNEDHADACLDYARALAGVPDAREARMIAVDRYGFDLRVATESGVRSVRLAFPVPVSTPNEVREAMVALLRRARAPRA
ncbi:MAG TPA: DUF2470 domain-containing protein [Sandaracinaceae bacterium]